MTPESTQTDRFTPPNLPLYALSVELDQPFFQPRAHNPASSYLTYVNDHEPAYPSNSLPPLPVAHSLPIQNATTPPPRPQLPRSASMLPSDTNQPTCAMCSLLPPYALGHEAMPDQDTPADMTLCEFHRRELYGSSDMPEDTANDLAMDHSRDSIWYIGNDESYGSEDDESSDDDQSMTICGREIIPSSLDAILSSSETLTAVAPRPRSCRQRTATEIDLRQCGLACCRGVYQSTDSLENSSGEQGFGSWKA